MAQTTLTRAVGPAQRHASPVGRKKALRARRWVNPSERVLSPLRGSLPYAFVPMARAMGSAG
jgi:hypothetical protein